MLYIDSLSQNDSTQVVDVIRAMHLFAWRINLKKDYYANIYLKNVTDKI